MCAEDKTNRVSLVSPDLTPIEQLWDELWRCIRDRSMQPGNLQQLLCIKKGHGFPRTLCDVTCFGFDLVMMQLLLLERFMSVFNELNSSELIYT